MKSYSKGKRSYRLGLTLDQNPYIAAKAKEGWERGWKRGEMLYGVGGVSKEKFFVDSKK